LIPLLSIYLLLVIIDLPVFISGLYVVIKLPVFVDF
jgi:hypothetical protein